MHKSVLRRVYIERRKRLSKQELLKLNDLMLIQFQQLSLFPLDILLSYWSFEKQNEPNTEIFERYLKFKNPNLTICYPQVFGDYQMQALATSSETKYIENRYGIVEPEDGQVVDPKQIDLVLVPMIVCDLKGNRIGYGKGYYDRFLAQCRKDVITVGLSYFDPVDNILDVHEFDIPLKYCITPERVYEFK